MLSIIALKIQHKLLRTNFLNIWNSYENNDKKYKSIFKMVSL